MTEDESVMSAAVDTGEQRQNLETACAELRDLIPLTSNFRDVAIWLHEVRFVHKKIDGVIEMAAHVAGAVVKP